MILLINICKEKFHYYEFVKPLEDIIKKENQSSFVKYYKEVSDKDLKKAEKIIICGTSLKDNDFSLSENLHFFGWMKSFNRPILGICGGMQVIGRVFGAKSGKAGEIGYFNENFDRNFLGLKGQQEVYHLHNNFIYLPANFEEFTLSDIPQAIKHRDKNIFGVLFHPEVRNKDMISEFLKVK